MVTLRDSLKKLDKQKKEVNPVTTGVDTWQGDNEDPFEIYEHENIGLKENNKQEE